MTHPIYSLFQDCTVCLQIPDERGTGFWVSPGTLLSCAHVVKQTAPEQISIHWQRQVFHPSQVLLASEWETIAHHDLVLLDVPFRYHPCVLLDEMISPGDRLHSYGYPDALEKRDGDSLTPNCSGNSDQGRMLTLRDENIRGGFSGAPLLSQETLKVCGLIKSDRLVQLDHLRRFGGRGIPVSQIYTQWPQLREQNQIFHQQNRQWQEAIAPANTPVDAAPSSNTPKRSNARRDYHIRRIAEMEEKLAAVEADLKVKLGAEDQRSLNIRADQILAEIDEYQSKLDL